MSTIPKTGPLLSLLLLAAILAHGGCATRVKVDTSDPQLARRLEASPLIALGGITVAPKVGGTLSPHDAMAAAAAMQRAFLNTRPQFEIWPVATVQQRLGADTYDGLAREYGFLGRLRADQVKQLARNLDGCSLLAIARLTADEARSNMPLGESPAPAAGSIARDEQDRPLTTTVSTERKITVTLEIFDLTTGSSLWLAQADARNRERYRYVDQLRDDPGGYMQERLATPESPVYLDRRGGYLKLPDLVELIEQALSAAAQRLPQTSR